MALQADSLLSYLTKAYPLSLKYRTSIILPNGLKALLSAFSSPLVHPPTYTVQLVGLDWLKTSSYSRLLPPPPPPPPPPVTEGGFLVAQLVLILLLPSHCPFICSIAVWASTFLTKLQKP